MVKVFDKSLFSLGFLGASAAAVLATGSLGTEVAVEGVVVGVVVAAAPVVGAATGPGFLLTAIILTGGSLFIFGFSAGLAVEADVGVIESND